jgi:uncharacterized protein with HEPN domain
MYDRELVRAILTQIDKALETIQTRTLQVKSTGDFTNSPAGMEKLDSVCMLFVAVGESIKKIDKLTEGIVLGKYPEIDWIGVKGFRDIMAHHYFDIDAEQVFWVCTHQLAPLSTTVKKMIREQ